MAQERQTEDEAASTEIAHHTAAEQSSIVSRSNGVAPIDQDLHTNGHGQEHPTDKIVQRSNANMPEHLDVAVVGDVLSNGARPVNGSAVAHEKLSVNGDTLVNHELQVSGKSAINGQPSINGSPPTRQSGLLSGKISATGSIQQDQESFASNGIDTMKAPQSKQTTSRAPNMVALPENLSPALEPPRTPAHPLRNKVLEQIIRTPNRQPSPQPTHLSVPGAQQHRVLNEDGSGYVAPKFEGKESQMEQGT